MTRCASPSLFAGIASFLSARTGGRFRLVIGFEAPEDQDSARDGAAIIEAAGGHALLMPRALPAPLTAFSVRMVMADGAVYVRASGEALIYLGGRAIDRSREGALAPDAELALIDEAVATFGDEASLPRAEDGWESVGDGMIGAYIDRCASRIASLAPSATRAASASIDEASGLLVTLLERLGIPVVEEGATLSLTISADGRTLTTSLPEQDVRTALADALTTSPAVPHGPGLYCVDLSFFLDGDGWGVGTALAAWGDEDRTKYLSPGNVPPGHCRLRTQLIRRKVWR